MIAVGADVVTNDARAEAWAEIAHAALYLSDIDFLRWWDTEYPLGLISPDAKALIAAQLPYYAFTESEAAYRRHYAKYEGKFYAGPVRQFVEHDWTQDMRYQAIRHAVRLKQPERVLDFGCSTGHISRTLATEMPNVEFVGVDITPQAIQWYNTLAPQNARAYCMDETEYGVLPLHQVPASEMEFDLIICAEVLEHLIDPYQTLDHLAAFHLKEGCEFLCTLPFGPWESRGWDTKDPWAREHVRHWGGVELLDVFGHDMLAWYVGNQELGHTITLSGPRVGIVDMKAKLARYERLVGSK